MAQIIVKPTLPDSPTTQQQADYDAALLVYNGRIEAIRLLASPDIASPMTADDIPESVIANSVYLLAAERRVMRDTAITDLTTVSADDLASLVYMTQILLAFRFLAQLPEQLRETLLGETNQFQEITLDQRKQNLLSEYNDELVVINPSSGKSLGFRIPVATTGSRYERSLLLDTRGDFNDYWSYFGL